MEANMTNIHTSLFAPIGGGLVRVLAVAGLLATFSAAANAANYQNGALKNCTSANSCTLNFPSAGGNLRLDYVSCQLLAGSAFSANASVISVFNGTHAIFLNTQQ